MFTSHHIAKSAVVVILVAGLAAGFWGWLYRGEAAPPDPPVPAGKQPTKADPTKTTYDELKKEVERLRQENEQLQRQLQGLEKMTAYYERLVAAFERRALDSIRQLRKVQEELNREKAKNKKREPASAPQSIGPIPKKERSHVGGSISSSVQPGES